jgi:hypothetical protein
MRLNEPFQICLLALANRYPEHVVDINEALLGPQRFGSEGWTAPELVEMLQESNPSLLQIDAQLVIDSQRSEILLLHISDEQPAVFVHCRGKIPARRGDTMAYSRVAVGAARTLAAR